MINYFLLSYQRFDYFKEKFLISKYQNTRLRIIDNGNQKIENYEIYKTKNNIGCAGGMEFNLLYWF